MGVDLFVIDEKGTWTRCAQVPYRRRMHRLTGLAVLQRMHDEGEFDCDSFMLALMNLDRMFEVDQGADDGEWSNHHWAIRNCDSISGTLLKDPLGGWERVPSQTTIIEAGRLEPVLREWAWTHWFAKNDYTKEDIAGMMTCSLVLQDDLWSIGGYW